MTTAAGIVAAETGQIRNVLAMFSGHDGTDAGPGIAAMAAGAVGRKPASPCCRCFSLATGSVAMAVHLRAGAVTGSGPAGQVVRVAEVCSIRIRAAVVRCGGELLHQPSVAGAGGMGKGFEFAGVIRMTFDARICSRRVVITMLLAGSADGRVIPVGGRRTMALAAVGGRRIEGAAPRRRQDFQSGSSHWSRFPG